MHFSHSICLRPARGRSVYTRWQGGNLETCWNYRFSLPQHLTHFCSHSSWCFTYMTRRLPGFYSVLSVLVKPFGWKCFWPFCARNKTIRPELKWHFGCKGILQVASILAAYSESKVGDGCNIHRQILVVCVCGFAEPWFRICGYQCRMSI